jgi:hypothetical protein
MLEVHAPAVVMLTLLAPAVSSAKTFCVNAALSYTVIAAEGLS